MRSRAFYKLDEVIIHSGQRHVAKPDGKVSCRHHRSPYGIMMELNDHPKLVQGEVLGENTVLVITHKSFVIRTMAGRSE